VQTFPPMGMRWLPGFSFSLSLSSPSPILATFNHCEEGYEMVSGFFLLSLSLRRPQSSPPLTTARRGMRWLPGFSFSLSLSSPSPILATFNHCEEGYEMASGFFLLSLSSPSPILATFKHCGEGVWCSVFEDFQATQHLLWGDSFPGLPLSLPPS
jgi:hypothetical protein